MLCSPSQPHRHWAFLTLQQLGIWAHAHSGHSTIKQLNLLQLQRGSRKELDPALWGPLEIGIAPCGGRTSLAGQPGTDGEVTGWWAVLELALGGRGWGPLEPHPDTTLPGRPLDLLRDPYLVKEKKKGETRQDKGKIRVW